MAAILPEHPPGCAVTRTAHGAPHVRELPFAAYEVDELIACSLVTHYRGRPLVAYVVTRPDRQGRGLASSLLAASAAALRRSGETEWTLAVTHGNPAQRLYERLGFRQDDSLRDGN